MIYTFAYLHDHYLYIFLGFLRFYFLEHIFRFNYNNLPKYSYNGVFNVQRYNNNIDRFSLY